MLVVDRGEICPLNEYERREQDILTLAELNMHTLYEAMLKLQDTKYADYGFEEGWVLKLPVKVVATPPSPAGMEDKLITLCNPDDHGNTRPPVLPCKITSNGFLRPCAPLFYLNEISIPHGYIIPRSAA